MKARARKRYVVWHPGRQKIVTAHDKIILFTYSKQYAEGFAQGIRLGTSDPGWEVGDFDEVNRTIEVKPSKKVFRLWHQMENVR